MKTAQRIRSWLTCLVLVLTTLACAPTRVVLVPPGTPVRLAEPVKAKVWAKDSTGAVVKSRNRVTIPEGWYALPKE